MNFYLGDLNLPREIPFKVCYSHNWQADGSFRLWVTSILSSKAMSFFMGPFRFLQNSLTDSKKSTRLLNQFLKLSLRGGWNCGLVDSKSWLAHSKPLVQTPAVHKPGMVVYICNFNTWEIEAGGYAPQDHLWLHRVWSHAGLNENLLFLKKNSQPAKFQKIFFTFFTFYWSNQCFHPFQDSRGRFLLANEGSINKHMVVFILPHWAPDGMYSANKTWSATCILYVSSKVPTSSYRFYKENKVSPYLCYVSPLNFPFLCSASSRNINPLPILLLWYFFKMKSIFVFRSSCLYHLH